MKSFSPKEIAKALDVSQASIKRWVDKGLIEAEKTAGGHRRISLQSLKSYLDTNNKHLVNPDVLDLPTGRLKSKIKDSLDILVEELKQCNDSRVRALIYDLYLSGTSPNELFDQLIKPSIKAIKLSFVEGQLDDFQEKRSLQICQRLLFGFEQYFDPPHQEAPHALLGTLSSDQNTLEIQMLEVCLRVKGMRTEFLGSELDTSSYQRALKLLKPQVLALGFSVLSENSLAELHVLERFCYENQILFFIITDLPISIEKEFETIIPVPNFSSLDSFL
jgi:MerR family transcriptional regulator, light-induced transcriptional regulator